MRLPSRVDEQIEKRALFAVVPDDTAYGNRMSSIYKPEKVFKQSPVIVFAPVGVVARLGIVYGGST